MKVLVTGSGGLIGSEAVRQFDAAGHEVVGVDNNMRQEFFGPSGDTTWNTRSLLRTTSGFRHISLDIRNRSGVMQLFENERFDAIIHCAAQPSHDLAARIPLMDFDVNAVGTMNLLEANRLASVDSPFIYMSTNKVYGDAPNDIPLTELATRWDYRDARYENGIPETFRIDHSKHSLFGASKLSADILVQEYGRYFSMPTCCLRGGCLTGPQHSGVELHGFLSYLIKCCLEGRAYTVYGYKAKQVRDNIHAKDVVSFFEHFLTSPKCGAVYNLGGGKDNSISVIEAIRHAECLTGRQMNWSYSDANRSGDHICYYSDLSLITADYPSWQITIGIPAIFEEIADSWQSRIHSDR